MDVPVLPPPADAGIFHVAADGTGLAEISATGVLSSTTRGGLVVDRSDGSLWVAENYPETRLAHFASDGSELWHDPNSEGLAWDLSVNPTDGSCWALYGDAIRHFAKTGAQFVSIPETSVNGVAGIVVDPITGFCWYAVNGYVSVFTPAGKCLWQSGGFMSPDRLRVSVRDGSLWMVSDFQGQLVHLWVPVTVFPDVLYDNWAAYGVSLCYRAGIVGGYEDGNYHPEYTVTRAQMAILVCSHWPRATRTSRPARRRRTLTTCLPITGPTSTSSTPTRTTS